LLLSTLDWALIETWKEAGIPLEAVLRGIDAAFDSYERKPSKTRKINSLGYCSQEVLASAEEMREAAVGTSRAQPAAAPGLEAEEIIRFLRANADKLRQASVADLARPAVEECAATLTTLAENLGGNSQEERPGFKLGFKLEDLERHLTVLEEKLLAALTMTAPEAVLLEIRTEADREIAPYRGRMPGIQMEQLRQQFLHKRLFERAKIPRLSLFYL